MKIKLIGKKLVTKHEKTKIVFEFDKQTLASFDELKQYLTNAGFVVRAY